MDEPDYAPLPHDFQKRVQALSFAIECARVTGHSDPDYVVKGAKTFLAFLIPEKA